MKKLTIPALIIALMLMVPAAGAASGENVNSVPADSAVRRLVEGNNRYVLDKPEKPNQTSKRRADVAESQHPFAIVVTCSDSRVPPEILFDQGIGDIFVIRTAGNVLDDAAIGSIEYAAEHLGVRLIVVLGHERCGAVAAAVKGGEAPGHLKSLVGYIQPAVKKAKDIKGGDLLNDSIRGNVFNTVEKLSECEPILKELCESGKLKVVGAFYDLDSGTVQFYEGEKHKSEKKEEPVIDK